MSEYIILRKHMLTQSYMIIKENVSKQRLIEIIQLLSKDDLKEYKFIKGKVIQPSISYNIADTTDESVIENDVVKKDDTIAQKIFRKWSQGSVFEQDNQGAF